jgi:exopolysaccharide biosynthesis WecB/TagA/CpsF family protein
MRFKDASLRATEGSSRRFLGIKFDECNVRDFAEFIIGSDQSFIVVTPNVDHVVRYYDDRDFRKIYERMDYVVNDSRVLRLLSRICGEPLRNVVPGSDLTKTLVEKLSSTQQQFAILGCDSAEVKEIVRRHDLHQGVFHINPSYGFINNLAEVDSIVERCLKNEPMVYFVCLGSPQQELLADRMKAAGVRGRFLCVGASLNFLSGSEKRAPVLVQLLCLEWLFRFVQSPGRLWRRYLLTCPRILGIAARSKVGELEKT